MISLVPESYQVKQIQKCVKVQQPKVIVVALNLPASTKGSYLYRFASFVSVLALIHKYVSEVLIQTNGYTKQSYTSYHTASTVYQLFARQLLFNLSTRQLSQQLLVSSRLLVFGNTIPLLQLLCSSYLLTMKVNLANRYISQSKDENFGALDRIKRCSMLKTLSKIALDYDRSDEWITANLFETIEKGKFI